MSPIAVPCPLCSATALSVWSELAGRFTLTTTCDGCGLRMTITVPSGSMSEEALRRQLAGFSAPLPGSLDLTELERDADTLEAEIMDQLR